MTDRLLRVLLLADTHLGFDDPARPRVARRRRGPDFFRCTRAALEPALRGDVDLVVHGGDLLYRARVPPSLVQRAMAPLFDVADRGVPVVLVPGNHERSRIPYPLLTHHPRVYLIDTPRTVVLELAGLRVAVAGFPFARVVDGPAFGALLRRTRWREHDADVRLLCMHQAVEGATVGVQDFTFRGGPDVVPGHAVPAGLAAVLSGHIHRAQILRHDLAGRSLAAPVCYPGSVERTSFAERDERKGFLLLRFAGNGSGGRLVGHRFVPLPARPMVVLDVDSDCQDAATLGASLRARLARLPPDAVVRVAPRGDVAPHGLHAAALRALAPDTMTIDLAPPPGRFSRSRRRRAAR